jgi:hypothetical protein
MEIPTAGNRMMTNLARSADDMAKQPEMFHQLLQ